MAGPIPEKLFGTLAAGAGLSDSVQESADRLIGLGLWEVHSPDAGASLLISGLARPHACLLSEEEQRAHAERIVEPLFKAWGGEAGRLSRPFAQDLEITRLAFLAGVAEILAVCALDAVTALERRLLNRDAADLGRRAIAFLDENGVPVPIGLLRKAAEICQLIGDTATARVFYGRAKEIIYNAQTHGLQLEMADRAAVLISHSRLLVRDGRINEALEGFEQARGLLSEGGQAREVAVTLGYIARIKVYRGEVDEALKLHEERQRVFEALGDKGEKAHTLWTLAQIDLAQGEQGRAAERLLQSYQINLGLRRLDGICFVGWDLGRLLCAGGMLTEGRVVLERSLAGFRQLRQDAMAQRVEAFLATLPPAAEDPSPPAAE